MTKNEKGAQAAGSGAMARPDSADGARCGRRAVDDRLFAGVPVGFAGERCRGERRRDDRRPMVTSVLLLSQKIFYFDMPVAITLFIALAFAGYYDVRFLMTKNRRFDTCSKIAMEIALLFVACTMITGDSVDEVRMGRVVDVGSAPDDVPHPHAHHHHVLHPAQRHRRARASRDVRGGAQHSSPSSTCRSALW